MNITDYTREPAKLAELLTHIAYGDGNLIEGRQLLLLRNAIDDLEGIGHAASMRKAELQQDARDEGYDSIDVVVRDLTFSDVHAFIAPRDCPDMTAAGEQVLTVYYASLQDEEGPYIELRRVAPAAPLVIKGEERDLVIAAGSDILHSLTKDRIDEIKDKVLDAIRMLQGEARIEMAEAA